MRLTLRALLAYLDDMLEPNDAQGLAQRIEASQFATDLVHRVRDVSRRLKLGAPKVQGRGLAGDANTVAEYLDNTMPPEQVAEFEKTCLQSDVYLAEVASAHQILALVLGEPAEIDAKMRRRMYALPQQEAQGEGDANDESEVESPVPGDVAVAIEPLAARRRPEIPEWLREPPSQRKRWLPLVATALLLISGSLGALYFYQQGSNPIDGTGRRNNADEPLVVASVVPAAGDAAASVAPGARTDGDRTSDPPLAATESANATEPADPDAGAPTAANLAGGPRNADTDPAVPINAGLATAPPASAAAERGVDMRAPIPVDPPLRRSSAAESDPFNTDISVAGDLPAEPPGQPMREEPTTALNDRDLIAGARNNAAPRDADSGAPLAVARLVNDRDVLLNVAPSDGSWRRVSVRNALLADELILALPTFRPGIALSTAGGATVHLLGGTVVRLLPPDAQGVPGLHVIDGQVVIATAGKPGTQVNVQVGEDVYLVTFVGQDATAAVDVRRWLPDGVDPMEEPATTTADLYIPSGEVEYTNAASGVTQSLKAPAVHQWTTKDVAAAGSEVTFPAWINGNPLTQVEKWAAEAVEKELTPDEPVQVHLRELADNRRVEVRNLAVHCLTLMGDFEVFLPLLNDEKQRINWSSQIDAVRRAMARDPSVAQQLKATLESQRDAKKSRDLYEMLRGYSKRQLQDGAAARLVADLDVEELDFRVLAFWNLQRVAVGTLGYKPEYAQVKRQQGVRAWKQKLAEGQIVPRSGN